MRNWIVKMPKICTHKQAISNYNTFNNWKMKLVFLKLSNGLSQTNDDEEREELIYELLIYVPQGLTVTESWCIAGRTRWLPCFFGFADLLQALFQSLAAAAAKLICQAFKPLTSNYLHRWFGQTERLCTLAYLFCLACRFQAEEVLLREELNLPMSGFSELIHLSDVLLNLNFQWLQTVFSPFQ